MKVRLSDHFTYKTIFRMVYPPILMMIFTSLYGVIDGLCIANFESASAFAGVNLIMPVIMIIGGVGFMFGAGGSALVSKLLGEKKEQRAYEVFTGVLLFTFILGIMLSLIGFFLVTPIVKGMASLSPNSTDAMVSEAIKYGRILMCGQSLFMMQSMFQSFFVTDEAPKVGFAFTLLSGCINIIFDLVFVAGLRLGVIGAAIATILGYVCGSVGPFVYFLLHKQGRIRFVKPAKIHRELIKVITNGSSEFVNNVSTSIVGVVYNLQLIKYLGQNGVAAYGTLMYVGFIFFATFIGYSIGLAPVIGFNYGAQNKDELNNILKRSMKIIIVLGLIMFSLAQGLAKPLSILFSSGDASLALLTEKALRIDGIIFLFCGVSVFISCWFTSLNNGFVSAALSFSRTLVFQIAFVFLFPLIMGSDGLWWAVVGAEVVAVALALITLFKLNKRYGYLKPKVNKNFN